MVAKIDFLISLVGMVVVYFFPSINWPKQPLGILLAVVFVGALLVGVILAAHSMYIEVEEKRDSLQRQLNNKEARKQAIRDKLAGFLDEGNHLVPLFEGRTWLRKVEDYLRTNLGSSYAVRFHTKAGVPQQPRPFDCRSTDELNLRTDIQLGLFRLNQFIGELS